MTKRYLVILQIIIALGIGFYFFPFKFYKKILFVNGYSQQLCYNIGDSAKFYINTSDSSTNYYFQIYNSEHQLYDSVSTKCWQQEARTDSISKYGIGYSKKSSFLISNKFLPGLYYFENKIPFFINQLRDSSDLIFVIPYFNKLVEDHNIGTNKIVCLNNFYSIDTYSLNILSFIDSLRNHYNVKIITDLDLENKESINTGKVILLYGSFKYWTEKAKLNFDNYILNGGNSILLSSYLMNNVVKINSSVNKVILANCDKDTCTWDRKKSSNYQSIGVTYHNISQRILLKNFKPFNTFKVINSTHNLLVGTNFNSENGISIEKHGFNCINMSSITKNIPKIDLKFIDFYKGEVIAYNVLNYKNRICISAITILQKNKNSGIILNYGSSGFIGKEYFNTQPIKILINNGINLVVNERNLFTAQQQIR